MLPEEASSSRKARDGEIWFGVPGCPRHGVARGSWPIVAALHAPLTRLATGIRRHDSDAVSKDEQQVRKRRWATPGVLWRDGPGGRLSSDKPWCPRRSAPQHEWRKMPRGPVEIADLHVRFAALRRNLAKSARVGGFSSAIRTADVPPASDVDQGRESVSDWIGERASSSGRRPMGAVL